MKTLIVLLLLVGWISTSQAQQITELEEAKVNFAPTAVKISSNLDNYTFVVKEDFAGEFVKNPIGFMKENFDINSFITSIDNDKYDEFLVTFKSSKGVLEASYDNEGNILKTNQRFKDIVLPLKVRRALYTSHTGWTMVQNKYMASGNGERIDREVYKIKIANGNKKQNIKIDPRTIGASKVASN
ncbi:hypothetical protein BC962_1903 [Gillisia mitskevichiae]|uniref:Uncharacterized protein n=1 Tax=Gillisia mitskevichiae TaxID=270921 RepID=A0A495PXU8_9FLAO|nr:hypothetical protein [Gillisia mitskevichiae]RKS53649.1 hypothetical protein BC962_1903 [Gillisia mitskevichiae]